MINFNEMTSEMQDFLNRKGSIKVAAPSRGGHTQAKVAPEFQEIFGETLFCENGVKKGQMNGRDSVRQKSQKVKWTDNVRSGMAHKMERLDRTGTEG